MRDLLRGAVAQLGERLNGIQEAEGSIPFSSTIFRFAQATFVQQGGTAGNPCPWQFICQGFFCFP